MKIQATTLDAYRLLHNGAIALSQAESNGIKIDEAYLNRAIKATDEKIRDLTTDLSSDEIYQQWRKRFGSGFNLESGDQLGKVLFEDMKYKCPAYTSGKKPKPKTDESTLESLNIPFVKKLLRIKKLKKARGTYLKGIQKEITKEGFIHPFFNLHLVSTFRSSSDSPNFQNFPIRNKELEKLIRRCFIPRAKNRQIVETDYSGIEVHGAAWYHKDPVMLSYICDKTKDMHRDMAQQCYALSSKEMKPINEEDAKRIKVIRYCGKNKFVFPEFYGDWWLSCANALWEAIDQMHLKTRDGLTLKQHLKQQGINRLGTVSKDNYNPPPHTFLNHIKEVEHHFWNKRFKIYKQWKDNWYEAYRKNGKFTTLTGFEIAGLMKKNEVINYPVQGVAFHCLLWSLIRIQKLLRKYKMQSLIIGQIHDSIVADVLSKELKSYLEIVEQVMTIDIKKHWKWIITPLEIEADVASVGASWYEKAKYKI